MVSNKHAYATDSAVRRAAGGGRRTHTRGPGPFGGLGRAVVHHPWLTILAWVVVAVAVIATSPGLPTTSNESSFLPKNYESIRAAGVVIAAFLALLTETGSLVAASASGSQLPGHAGGAARATWIAGAQKVVPDLNTVLRRVEEHCLPLESARAQQVYGQPSAVNRLLILNAEPRPGHGTVLLRQAIGFWHHQE
jgi:hypothetical protein